MPLLCYSPIMPSSINLSFPVENECESVLKLSGVLGASVSDVEDETIIKWKEEEVRRAGTVPCLVTSHFVFLCSAVTKKDQTC